MLALQLSSVENELAASLRHAEKGGEDDGEERNELDHDCKINELAVVE